MGAIINLAQNYTGSNNWNLLKPNGQFGTRLLLGKDSASPRYIFTELSEYSKSLFDRVDLEIVEYIFEEGQQIEPKFYIPLLPIVLINGCQGIGTGYSTFIPTFNPKDIINNIKLVVSGKEPVEMVPWYSGFTGSIVKNGEGSYEISGVYSKVDGNTIRVTDIPIGVSIEDYKMFLETFVENNTYNLVSMVNGSDEVNVSFTLRFNSPLSLNKFLELGSESYKVLKLVKNLSTRNMHLFDEFGVIQKYNSPEEILKEFVKVRINYYSKRKEHIVSSLTRERLILENKYRFVTSIIDGTLVVNMKSKSTIFKDR
jgi:DNA topoisomerase-2